MRTNFISDDGKVESDDRKVVEKYEADLNPLRIFGFPWTWVPKEKTGDDEHWRRTTGGKWFPAYVNSKDMRQITAFINLVPLIEELRKETLACRMKDFHDWEGDADEEDRALRALLLAYEKALEESK